MFPIRDHNPSLETPYVTYALIAINVLVFLMYLPLLGDEARLAAFFDRWALTPARFMAGDGTVFVAFWCYEECISVIRWFKLAVGP